MREPRLVQRELLARCLNNVSPWSREVGSLNEIQAELLLRWRIPPDEDAKGKTALTKDLKRATPWDEALWGEKDIPKPPQEDEFFDEAAPSMWG